MSDADREVRDQPASVYARGASESGIALGVCLIVLGVIAMMVPTLTTVVKTLFLGAILFASGIVRFIQAFANRGAPNFTWQLLTGVLAAAAGVLMVVFPAVGMLTLTVLLGSFFLVEGMLKVVVGVQLRRMPRWGWLCFSGLVTIGLGWILLAGLPSTAAWALGLIIGVELFVEGLVLISGATTTPPFGTMWRHRIPGK